MFNYHPSVGNRNSEQSSVLPLWVTVDKGIIFLPLNNLGLIGPVDNTALDIQNGKMVLKVI